MGAHGLGALNGSGVNANGSGAGAKSQMRAWVALLFLSTSGATRVIGSIAREAAMTTGETQKGAAAVVVGQRLDDRCWIQLDWMTDSEGTR